MQLRCVMVRYLGFRSTGVESRAASAIDIALWDIFGKAANKPIVQMLGGWTRYWRSHLQHLCRWTIHAKGADPINEELGHLRAVGLVAGHGIRRSQRFPDEGRRFGGIAARRRNHGHEDLAV